MSIFTELRNRESCGVVDQRVTRVRIDHFPFSVLVQNLQKFCTLFWGKSKAMMLRYALI